MNDSSIKRPVLTQLQIYLDRGVKNRFILIRYMCC